ncbi:hypothetical protein OEA41_008734 [Lepraria neglecta]|uniref:Uncharacterized protein n=1 Tax=Lepraria neglecta TaxID=209136 RepID=A0AAD9Z0N7_9LECA|nr:hypothetical protein OEA41_008734 [Lepraria neglecta]
MASTADQGSPEESAGASGTPPSSTDMANTNENAGSGPPMAGNGSPLPLAAPTASNGIPSSSENADSGTIAPPPTGGSPGADKGLPGSSESGDNALPAAGSGNPGSPISAGSPGVCGPHTTVMMTTEYTVTITQAAEAGNLAGTTNAAQRLRRLPSNGAVPSSLAANAFTGRRRTKCSKATRTVVASASSGIGNLYGNGTQDSPLEKVAIPPKVPGSSPQEAATQSPSPAASTSQSNSMNTTSNVNGEFWAGATLGTLIRMANVPNRVFYDYDCTTVKDPFKTLGDAGVNAVRVEAIRGQCLGPTKFVNNASTLSE